MGYKTVAEILNEVFDSSDSVLKGVYKTEGEVLNMVLEESEDSSALRVKISGVVPTNSIIDGEVITYVDLPPASEHIGEIYIVTTSTGVPLINRKQAGMYRSNGAAWSLLDVDMQADKVYYSGTVSADNVAAALDALKTSTDGKAETAALTTHTNNTDNPHNVTAAQVGAYTKGVVDGLLSNYIVKANIIGVFSNLSAPLTHLPLKKNLLTAQGQSICTFTRASVATYTDRYGTLKTAAADIPRFTADGLLIEGASTNLLTYSEQFDNAAWTKTRSSVSANITAVTDPYGTNLADKLIEDTTATITHLVSQLYSFTAGTTYTFSVYAKAGSRSQMALRFGDSGLAAGFDLSSGTVLSASAGITTKITALTNGWYRVSVTETAVNSGSYASQIQLMVSGATSYTGDGTSGLYIFGAQLEAVPFATSYIPTTTASATRAADNCSFPRSDNMIKLQQSTGHSYVADVKRLGMLSGIRQIILGGASYTNFLLGTYNMLLGAYNKYGVYDEVTLPSALTEKTRLACVYTGHSTEVYADGVKFGTGVTLRTYEAPDDIYLGRDSSGGHFYGTISNLRIYDRALTETEVYAA